MFYFAADVFVNPPQMVNPSGMRINLLPDPGAVGLILFLIVALVRALEVNNAQRVIDLLSNNDIPFRARRREGPRMRKNQLRPECFVLVEIASFFFCLAAHPVLHIGYFQGQIVRSLVLKVAGQTGLLIP